MGDAFAALTKCIRNSIWSRNFCQSFLRIRLKTKRKSLHRNMKGFCLQTRLQTKKKQNTTSSKFEGILSSKSETRLKTKKKQRSLSKFEGILCLNSVEDEKKEKRSSPQISTLFGRSLRFIGANSHFFV